MESAIPMRRKRQSLPEETCIEVLERGTSGVLALNDPEQGVPYQVPVNYGYRDGRLTFHGATVGHKVELLKADPRASFTVIDQDQIVPEQYTSWFRSVVCTGRLRLLTDPTSGWTSSCSWPSASGPVTRRRPARGLRLPSTTPPCSCLRLKS